MPSSSPSSCSTGSSSSSSSTFNSSSTIESNSHKSGTNKIDQHRDQQLSTSSISKSKSQSSLLNLFKNTFSPFTIRKWRSKSRDKITSNESSSPSHVETKKNLTIKQLKKNSNENANSKSTTNSNSNNNNNTIYLKNTQKSNTIKIKAKPQNCSSVGLVDDVKSESTDQVDSNRFVKTKDVPQSNIISPSSILTKDILDNDVNYCSSYALRSQQNKFNASILNEPGQLKNDPTSDSNKKSLNNHVAQITMKPLAQSNARFLDNKNHKSSIVINTSAQMQSSPQTERQASYLKLACYLNGYNSFSNSSGDRKLNEKQNEETRDILTEELKEVNQEEVVSKLELLDNKCLEKTILPVIMTVTEQISLIVIEKEPPVVINNNEAKEGSSKTNETILSSSSESPINVNKDETLSENEIKLVQVKHFYYINLRFNGFILDKMLCHLILVRIRTK